MKFINCQILFKKKTKIYPPESTIEKENLLNVKLNKSLTMKEKE